MFTAEQLASASHIKDGGRGFWHRVLRVTETVVVVEGDVWPEVWFPFARVAGYAVDGRVVA